ncbi:MAG: hypothetical protein PUA49_09180 [Butyrivibrio sp.]|nr:hypothetical protein [Butyrivibrio sp.]
MTKLIEIREKLKDIYAKSGIYIRHILTFLLAFFSLFIVSRAVGSHSLIANPLVCVAIALVCAFFPINVTVIVSTIYIIINMFSVSLELAIIATAIILVVYLLYFRFAPKTGIILLLTPLFFCLKIPYLMPVVVALTVGLTGIVPTVCGCFIYYLVQFAAANSSVITTMDADNALQNITFIFNNILTNKELVVVVVSFSMTIVLIYMLKRMSCKNAWTIAIVSGCIFDMLIQIISFAVMSVEYSIPLMIIGHIVAIGGGILINFFIFSVDYNSTEYVQFEDDDYYYYVKAVPKIKMAEPNVRVKHINKINGTKGKIHTESFDDEEIDE